MQAWSTFRMNAAVGVALLASLGIAGAAITDPLMPDSLIFITRQQCGGWNHMVKQYSGDWACTTGALYMMTEARSGTPRITNIVANSTVQSGRLAGKKLVNGGFLSLDLSYDARTVLFAWVEEPGEGWTQRSRYHIFKANVDGTGLTQLTDGIWNDFDPCWLPNGRIVFISERRGGYGRCHTSSMPTYTLYSMKDDGSDTICLSYHETNEWNPSVNNDGMIVYSRWDYIDRDDCIAHHLWTCYPDGRDPRAPHGNYPLPWSTMTGSGWRNGRLDRPDGEWHIRAIPNSGKYVAIASGHHQQSYGDVIIIDPSIPDDNKVSQITRITKTFGDPGWGEWGDQAGRYSTPWPLSDARFLCNRDSSIVLLNADGTFQTVYRAADGRPVDPIPLRPRAMPPALSTSTWQGERAGRSDHYRATISVMDVKNGDMPLPAGTVVKSMRILQVIPKATTTINVPQTGYASEGLARVSLGTVPVESDGSVYCEAPVGKDIYFQLLDDKGMAVQSMRSATYVHAGEQMTCLGCHEDKWTAPPATGVPLALGRAPSPLTPEAGAESNGVTLINFARLVKPVIDRTCLPCHTQRNQGPTNMSYDSLYKYAFWYCSKGTGDRYLNGDITTPVFGGSRTTPGMFGAAYSRMGKALLNQTHQAAGITDEEFRRVTLWLDANSMELSAYSKVTEQKAGQLVWPELDYDSLFPTGVETNRPLPGTQTRIPSRLQPVQKTSNDRPVVRNGLLKVRNPGLGPVRVAVTDASGRLVVSRRSSEPVIVVPLRSARQPYFVFLYGPDMQVIRRIQILSQ